MYNYTRRNTINNQEPRQKQFCAKGINCFSSSDCNFHHIRTVMHPNKICKYDERCDEERCKYLHTSALKTYFVDKVCQHLEKLQDQRSFLDSKLIFEYKRLIKEYDFNLNFDKTKKFCHYDLFCFPEKKCILDSEVHLDEYIHIHTYLDVITTITRKFTKVVKLKYQLNRELKNYNEFDTKLIKNFFERIEENIIKEKEIQDQKLKDKLEQEKKQMIESLVSYNEILKILNEKIKKFDDFVMNEVIEKKISEISEDSINLRYQEKYEIEKKEIFEQIETSNQVHDVIICPIKYKYLKDLVNGMTNNYTKLTRITIFDQFIEFVTKNDECSICYEEQKEVVKLSCCKQKICSLCLLKCRDLSSSCPFCRKRISTL